MTILISFPLTANTDGSCLLASWAMSKFVIAVKHDKPKSNLPKQKGIYPSQCSVKVGQLANVLFRKGNVWKKFLFQGTLPTNSEGPLFSS